MTTGIFYRRKMRSCSLLNNANEDSPSGNIIITTIEESDAVKYSEHLLPAKLPALMEERRRN